MLLVAGSATRVAVSTRILDWVRRALANMETDMVLWLRRSTGIFALVNKKKKLLLSITWYNRRLVPVCLCRWHYSKLKHRCGCLVYQRSRIRCVVWSRFAPCTACKVWSFVYSDSVYLEGKKPAWSEQVGITYTIRAGGGEVKYLLESIPRYKLTSFKRGAIEWWCIDDV